MPRPSVSEHTEKLLIEMHWKPKRRCVGALLTYTITIALYSVGWCEPTTQSSQTASRLALHVDRSRVLTIGGLNAQWSRGGRERLHLRSRQGGEARSLPRFDYLQNRDRTRAEPSEERPEETLRPRMAPASTDKSFQKGAKLKQSKGNRVRASFQPAKEDCSKGKIEPVTRGKFYITGLLETSSPHVGYQSDSAASGQEEVRGQQLGTSEESWQRLQPAVQCGDATMTLSVRRRPAAQLLLQRVNESSVPLVQVPPQCGYSVQASRRDLSLVAQYDACHVTQEGGSYVLPLLWRGTPVQMTCPASQSQAQTPSPPPPPSLCCSPLGMAISIHGLSAPERLRVNVRGEWTDVVVLAQQCGYTLDRQAAGVVITAPFITCGVTVKDGKYTLFLQMGDQTFTLSCPVTSAEELPVTSSLQHPTQGPAEEQPQPLLWAPPFHLAPLYYPHPTFHHQYLEQQDPHESDPPAPSSSTPDPVFSPQHLPQVDSQPDYQGYSSHQIPAGESYEHFAVQSFLPRTNHPEGSGQLYPDLHQKEVPPTLGLSGKHRATNSPSTDVFPTHPGALPLPPSSHASIQYYHYYHHPKIPLPEIPQDLDASPDLPPSTKPNSADVPALPRSLQQSPGRVDFSQPVPEAFSQPHTLPTGAPYPPQLNLQHYPSYLPHTARGEAKRFAPISPTVSANPSLSAYQNTKPSTLDHLLARSSDDRDGFSSHAYTGEPNPSKMAERNSQEWMKHPLLSDDEEAELEPPGSEAISPTPSSKHNLPPSPYYYYYYYYPIYQMYYGPERLLGTDNNVSPTSSKRTVDPLPPSSSPPQHPPTGRPLTPSTASAGGVHHHPLHPLYYYYYYYHHQPGVPEDEEEAHPAGSTGSESESPLPSDSDHKRTGWLLLAPDGYPSTQHTNQVFGIYFHDLTQDHPHEAYQEEERLDNEMKGHLRTNLCHSPCGLSHVSDFDCGLSMGCCLYSVPDCLEQGSHLLDAQDTTNRLKVDCSSSTGEVSLHGLDQPPEPAIVTVQLRIATDASFTSFHPEAHRPLADLRGRPVYVELRLLGPPEPSLVLLLHSCLAYSLTPYTGGMLVYDGCASHPESQLLPSPHSDHIRRIKVSSFLPLPPESPSHYSEEPEIFFLCLTEVCSAADSDCTLGCIDSPNSDV